MFRSMTCGQLRLADVDKEVVLAGWVQRVRKMGGMTFIDLRDRYGITQLVFNQEVDATLCETANHLGREYVIQIKGVRGIILAGFIVCCLIAGFIAFPGLVLMYLWNYMTTYLQTIPAIGLFQGILLWGIILASYFLFRKEK